jgi:hypothetical protein
LLPGRTLPLTVPTPFACDAITDAGFTSSLTFDPSSSIEGT